MDIMQGPPSVPLDKLASLLGKSMAVMKKAEKLKPQKINESVEEESDDEINAMYEQSTSVVDYATRVNNSGLPDAIKKLMFERPINTPSVSPPTALYNESDEKEMPVMKKIAPKTTPKQPLREQGQIQDGMITISEAKLEEMINAKLLHFFKTNYDKVLTEQAINKTIKTLISEGVLTVKKKI